MSGFPPQDSSSIDATLAEPSEGVGALLGDRYRLLALLGFGQSSRVYLAEDTATGTRVAVKGLRPWLSRDALFLQRFRGEATALAQLSHPNVVNVLDWGATATETYLVVEAFGGGSLGDLGSGGVRLSPSQALLVGLQAAQGLHYAHSLGWAHRDLKPTKLLFTPAGRLGIGGFGIARVVVQAPGVEAPVNDRARYRPPEEVINDRGGRSADVYALAVILIEAVIGDVPLLGDGATMTKALRAENDLPVPEEFGSLQPALEAAGRRDPSARLTAAELVEALTVAARTLPRPRPIPVPDVDDLLAQEQALGAHPDGAGPDAETIDLRDGGANSASDSDLESGGGAAGLGDSLQAIPISVPPSPTMGWKPPSTLPAESVAPHRPIADIRPIQAFPLAADGRSKVELDEPEDASSVESPDEASATSSDLMGDPDPTIEPPPRRDVSSPQDDEHDSGVGGLAGVGRSGFGILLGEVDLRPTPNHALAPSSELDDAAVVGHTMADHVEEGVDLSGGLAQSLAREHDNDQDIGSPDPEATLEAPLMLARDPLSEPTGVAITTMSEADHAEEVQPEEVQPEELQAEADHAEEALSDQLEFVDKVVTIEAAAVPPRRKEDGVFGLAPMVSAAEAAPTDDTAPIGVLPLEEKPVGGPVGSPADAAG